MVGQEENESWPGSMTIGALTRIKSVVGMHSAKLQVARQSPRDHSLSIITSSFQVAVPVCCATAKHGTRVQFSIPRSMLFSFHVLFGKRNVLEKFRL